MFKPVVQMEKILKLEMDIYKKLFKLEEEKREAILNRDWGLLESLSVEQNSLFPSIETLESGREDLIKEYRKINNLDDLDRELKLKDIVLSMDEDSSHHLLQMGIELKEIVNRVSDIVKNNNVLISDNMEFFNILISGLKNNGSVQAGYNENGKEDTINKAASIFFNHTA